MRQVVVYGVSVQRKILVLVYNSFVVYTMALTNKKMRMIWDCMRNFC